ncbi:MAG TPA: recombination protein RecR [Candidatus Wildermuthbacteria bacterium]|nr:recombination protein RecR [Candidatus Wildermuthbacteria bacterium]
MYPKAVQNLIEIFSKFPGVGRRGAARFVFYLLKASKEDAEQLMSSITELRANTALCSFCFNPFDKRENGDTTLCTICRNSQRNTSLLCVVEKESDLEALEKTKKYSGLYFILGGTVGQLRREDLKKLRVQILKEYIVNPTKAGLSPTTFDEVILAINPTTEGEATMLYLERMLEPLKIKTTRLGRGLPMGGEMEYADEETLTSALESRR